MARPSGVGILDIEFYFPSYYVDQSELEECDKVSSGKYTKGLGQKLMSFCSDSEDVNSMCLTVVQRLLERRGMNPQEVGCLEVGTESLTDKSKSVKSVLMQFFEKSGNFDVEGTDCLNACYGGTQALFHAVSWVESTDWDGRLALAVMGDIAVYPEGPARCTGGAGAVGILIGPNAPLVLDSGLRARHMKHVYDFFKPIPGSEYPVVDGKLSLDCYTDSLDHCFNLYMKKFEKKYKMKPRLDSFSGVLFHTPYCKLVEKSFARLHCFDLLTNSTDDMVKKICIDCIEKTKSNLDESQAYKDAEKKVVIERQSLFEEKTRPSLFIAKRVGNMYTASLYAGLVSLLIKKPLEQLIDGRLLLFSYGSGSCAAMFSLSISSSEGSKSDLRALIQNLTEIRTKLKQRIKKSPQDFVNSMQIREEAYGKKSYNPVGEVQDICPNTFHLTEVDQKYNRHYKRHEVVGSTVKNHSLMNGVA